jgi:cell division protein FtsX
LLWRNRFWSLLLGFVICAVLLLVYEFAAMSSHVSTAAEQVDDRLVVTALIAQDDQYKSVVAPEKLAAQVRALPEVTAVRVVDETETRRRFLQSVGDLHAKPAVRIFNDALEISVDDVEHVAGVRDRVRNMQGVQSATYLDDVVKSLSKLSSGLRNLALYVAIAMAAFAAVLVTAVVRTSIHFERRSVETMSAVGGSTWTIALPLIVHVLCVTLIATALACAAGYVADPMMIRAAFGSSQLPDWLDTGRAFGLFELFPVLFAGAAASVTTIVSWATFRYARH